MVLGSPSSSGFNWSWSISVPSRACGITLVSPRLVLEVGFDCQLTQVALQPCIKQMRASMHHAGVAVEDGRVKGAAVVRFQGDRERHMTVWEASCTSCPAKLTVPEAHIFL